MRLSDLQNKNIVSITDGRNIGNIIDVELSGDGRVDAFIIEQTKNIFSFNRDSEMRVTWSDITKIGEDVILVEKD